MFKELRENWRLLGENSNLKNYFLLNWLVVFGLNLNSSIFFIYPLSLGLNFSEMMFVYFTVSRIVYLIALIPTGIIADKFSARFCIIFTFFAYAMAYFSRGFLPFIIFPLTAFIISETIMGTADASFSGADEKYSYSFSKKIADSKIFSISLSVKFAIRAFATLFGGIIISYSSMRWTQVIGGIIIFIAFLASFKAFAEPKERSQQTMSIGQIYKDGLKHALKDKKTFYLIFGLALLSLGLMASRNVFQPLLVNLGLNINKTAVIFSLIFTIQMLFSSFGSYIVQKIDQKIRLSLALLSVSTLLSIFIFSLAFTKLAVIAAVLIWLIAFAEGSYYTQSTVLLNRFIPSDHIRATVNSLSALISALVIVIFMPIIGRITDHFGIKANLYTSAGLIIAGALILYIPHLNNKNTQKTF